MMSPKTLARIAGAFYLAMFVCSVFATYVRGRIVVPANAAATADNIRAAASLFRLGFLSDLVQITCMLLAAMALHLLLRHVNQPAAAAMVIFVSVAVAIGCLNLLNQLTALLIADSPASVHAFGRPASDALTMLFVDMQANGYFISAIFWGLWLLPLAYLVVVSGLFPRLLGVLLFIGGVGYLVDLVVRFVGVSLPAISPFMVPGAIAELLFAGWLVVRAVRVPLERARVAGPISGDEPARARAMPHPTGR